MDQFGVLVESIGFKSQGKSAPLADLKGKTNINDGFSQNSGFNSGFNTKPSFINSSKSQYNSNSINGSFVVDDLDGIFRSNNHIKAQNFDVFNSFDDIFGGPNLNSKPSEMFDLDSVFKGSSNLNAKSSVSNLFDGNDHIFGGMTGFNSLKTVNHNDVFGAMTSPPKQNDSIDDLLGGFGGMASELNGLRRNSGKKEDKGSGFDDLIPGFGGSSPSNNGAKSETSRSRKSGSHSAKSISNLAEDPFVIKGKQESVHREQREKVKERAHGNTGERRGASTIENDLESFFMGARPTAAQSQRATNGDPVFDTLFQKSEGSKVERPSYRTSSSTKKASSVTNTVDDFSFLFGFEAVPSSGEFQEVEGESEERRRARFNHHQRTQARMAKALNEKNQRDLQTQLEQEERHRLAVTLDDDIKRWAAGKEGNLRALLSSLQYMLWPDCGWQPVSLTDLITSTSVKKVYYKATLCVHPDKVQQKGANLQQKYIAEKVFDLLKEAWNKFSKEEL